MLSEPLTATETAAIADGNRVIDASAEFDQVRPHNHRPGELCWCGQGEGKAVVHNPSTDAPRHVSPAILEHRIAELKQKLTFVADERDKLAEQNKLLRTRIAGFEALSRSLSTFLDEQERAFVALTGQTPTAFVAAAEPLKAA